jgi:F0F1-type ATP synthase membrane subunit b/b'
MAEALINSGVAKSINDAAKQISEDTGETKDGVRMKINRGKEKIEQHVQQPENQLQQPEIPQENKSAKCKSCGKRVAW